MHIKRVIAKADKRLNVHLGINRATSVLINTLVDIMFAGCFTSYIPFTLNVYVR